MKKLIYILAGFSFTFSASAQLQNLDFELCDTSVLPQLEDSNCLYPQGWTRTNGNPFSEGYSFTFGNGGVADAQNGDMALRLSVWYTFDKDMAYQRAAYTSFPGALSGYYMYTENVLANTVLQIEEPDTATVTVLLSKWNDVLSHRDTIGFGHLKLNGASSYTAFSCPINYVSTVAPDSILILLNCSRMREQQGLMGNLFGNNSYFTVDNLSLGSSTLGLEETTEMQSWKVFPNPGNGMIHIPDFKGNAAMFDINGKMILDQSYPDAEIDASLLPQGIYLLHLTEKSGRVSFTKYVKQ